MPTLKNTFKDIYKTSIDVENIKNAKGSIDKITNAIKDLNAEQAVYKMELAGCSKVQMMDVLQKNKIAEASINAALAKQANTSATIANTTTTEAQTTAEENELLQQWLSISGEKADTVATNENTAAKSANLSVTNLLRVAWEKLTDIVKANPFIALSAGAVTLDKVMYELADRVYNAEKYAKEAPDESGTKVDSVRSEIESLNSKLQTTQNRFNELSTKENLSLVEQEELDRLKETNAELEREIRLKNSILSEEQKEALADVDLAGTTAGEIQNLIDENGYWGETLSG